MDVANANRMPYYFGIVRAYMQRVCRVLLWDGMDIAGDYFEIGGGVQ